MKEQYTADDFDPATRLYAVDGKDLVGFHMKKNKIIYEQLTVYIAGLERKQLETVVSTEKIAPALSFYLRSI